MKTILIATALLTNSAAMANDLNAAKSLFFSTITQQVSYDIDRITFTTAQDTGVTPRGGGTEYYLAARTGGPVMFKCDGLIVVRNGKAEEVAPKSFAQLCIPID